MLLEAANTSELVHYKACATNQNPINLGGSEESSDICALY
jgi:hypothetical protein